MKLSLDLPSGLTPDLVKGYCIIHQLENWFRELVYLELKASYGSAGWEQVSLALKRNRAAGISPEKSLKADKRHPHMATPENDPLWFLSFDSLVKIVFDRKLWRLFEPYLTTKTLLRAKFDEIKPIRNRIAHCRSLDKHDLKRLEAFLRDLDHGFWRFCTSYNRECAFIGPLQNDPVYGHFADREHVPFAEVEPGKWARIGMRVGVDVDLILGYRIRPSAKPRSHQKVNLVKGAIYDSVFSIAHRTGHYLDFEEILTSTKFYHQRTLHIFLDACQVQLRVTFPAVEETSDVMSAAEAFYGASLRSQRVYPSTGVRKTRTSLGRLLASYEEQNRPFEVIAANWPHYVIPPSHPFSFLYPDMPCSLLHPL
ncbi:MAG TPA: hypothetical protein VLT62_31735 [Candidatus Methylomirabilis sp.]|nr:hypothetical protein [Candidatus Methylomirabilis sp.]